jgi:hypothetical protein
MLWLILVFHSCKQHMDFLKNTTLILIWLYNYNLIYNFELYLVELLNREYSSAVIHFAKLFFQYLSHESIFHSNRILNGSHIYICTDIYIYIYIRWYICVCVCVYALGNNYYSLYLEYPPKPHVLNVWPLAGGTLQRWWKV